jgi:CheY-like chemotaxis protein
MKDALKSNLILLADDDSDDCLLVKDALLEAQWSGELKCVENGEELMDFLFRRGRHQSRAGSPQPGLILLDLNMPRKDGREALRQIKSDPVLRRIPVVVLTTSKADADIAALYDLGANSFITKPVQFDALVNVLRTLDRYWFGTVQLPLAT